MFYGEAEIHTYLLKNLQYITDILEKKSGSIRVKDDGLTLSWFWYKDYVKVSVGDAH